MSFQDKMLEKDIYAGLVTSLSFHNDSILLVGHGPFLKIYNVQTGQLLASQCILPANRIHRIVIVPQVQYLEDNVQVRQIAVYGSKYLSILQLLVKNNEQVEITVDKSFGPFADWIMDAQWIYDGTTPTPTQMSFVFAHNNFALFDLSSTTPQLLYSIQCQVRCILYSARIFGYTKDALIIASGTVFNEVHLWKPFITDEHSDAVVYKKLIGHEGVIFGMRFNDDASQIVSVSDDRTIRVWPLNKEEEKCLVLFGHTARVWDCQFVDEYLVSISEDSTCRVWKNTLVTPPDEDDTGDCIACWEGHASKNVWSCAVNPEHKIVATGGQDSGVRLWSLLSIKNNKIDSEEDLVPFPLPKDRKPDNIRNFVVIKNRWIVAATLEGYLLKCDSAMTPHQWVEIQHDPSYKNYAIMKNSECGRVVVVGNIVGELVIISPTDAFEPFKISAHKQKLFEIFIESSSDENILHVISNGYNDSVLFHRLDLSTPRPTMRTLFNFEMPVERTTVMSLSYAETERILICGSRESALLIYRLPCHTSVPENTIQTIKPALQLRKSHGKQAITSVLINTPSTDDDSLIFWTTGRDGCYIQYRLCITGCSSASPPDETKLGVASRGDTILAGQDMLLEKLYRNRVTKGTLEGSLFIDNQLLLMGFFRKNFFVYNEKKNFVMVAINCGGGHRRWGFSTEDAKLDKSAFAFIRKEELYVYFRDTSSVLDGFKDSILQSNYHGRDVRALRFLPVSDEAILFATSGEDTILKIHQYTPQGFHTHVNIRKHTTVIKNIDYSDGLLFTSGGLEEFRCWKLETLPPKQPGGLVTINCLEVAVCPTLTEDIESRIMDTAVYAVNGLHVIAAVYSDAMIRFWLFNQVTRKFSLVADGTWHAKCILQVSLAKLGDHVYFFTSATDGRVAVWDINDQLLEAIKEHEQLELEPTKAAFRLSEPVYHFSVHMNGVNALEAVPYKDGKHILVVTGGEDNAVSATLLEVQDGSVSAVNKPFIVASAHASSVTGIKYIDDAVFTISTDQRLNKWKVIDDGADGVTLEMENATYMDVPDPNALDGIIAGNQVHIATSGIGLQSVKYTI